MFFFNFVIRLHNKNPVNRQGLNVKSIFLIWVKSPSLLSQDHSHLYPIHNLLS
ncbi:hypothetical protein [Acinetobacter phage Ab69]|nr:hypothetical protein [Acinetobacter phage Ab69]